VTVIIQEGMKAKRHPLLGDITQSLHGSSPSVEPTIFGHKYKLEVLRPEGEDWVTEQAEGGSLASFALSTQKPRIAAAIIAIDDVPLEALFTLPDELTGDAREELVSNPTRMRRWRREQMLAYLKEESDQQVVTQLHNAYVTLVGQHREVLQQLGNFPVTTPSSP
jgi:hypothetical protein